MFATGRSSVIVVLIVLSGVTGCKKEEITRQLVVSKLMLKANDHGISEFMYDEYGRIVERNEYRGSSYYMPNSTLPPVRFTYFYDIFGRLSDIVAEEHSQTQHTILSYSGSNVELVSHNLFMHNRDTLHWGYRFIYKANKLSEVAFIRNSTEYTRYKLIWDGENVLSVEEFAEYNAPTITFLFPEYDKHPNVSRNMVDEFYSPGFIGWDFIFLSKNNPLKKCFIYMGDTITANHVSYTYNHAGQVIRMEDEEGSDEVYTWKDLEVKDALY